MTSTNSSLFSTAIPDRSEDRLFDLGTAQGFVLPKGFGIGRAPEKNRYPYG